MATAEMFQLCPRCGMFPECVVCPCSVARLACNEAAWAPTSLPVSPSHSEPTPEELDPALSGPSASPLPATPLKAKQQRKAPTPIGQKSEAGVRRQIQKNSSQEGHRAMSKQITALCKENRAHGMERETKVSSRASVSKWAEEYGLTWDGASDHFKLAPASKEIHASQVTSLREQGIIVWESPCYSRRNTIPALGKITQFWNFTRE